METNTCKVNNSLSADALLPPRKRLLAGLKRQNSSINSPSPPKDDSPFDSNPLIIAQLNNSNLPIEDIVEASRIAAAEAAKIAKSARAKSEEKAEKAAKAFSAARNALDIVATLFDEAAKKGKCLNKIKKHTALEELYNKKNNGTNSIIDKELARNLHRTINSSPRILKNSDMEIHKRKRLKGLGNTCDEIASTSNGVAGNGGIEDHVKKIDAVMVGLNGSKPEFGRKKGRMKQKKLLLSVCSFRDQVGFKEEGSSVGRNGGLFSSGNDLVYEERTQTRMWKCQSLKVTSCVQQNEVMQL